MGCGSSGSVVPVQEETGNGHSKTTNGVKGLNGHHDNDHDSLPTVVLPETPVKPKPPVAFEIPLDEFDANRKEAATPPPHLQRLLQPPQPEISLPDIEEKLAEAEQRRLSIPLDGFDANRKEAATPPSQLQKLLQPSQPEISLPDIAEAEQRRLSILQQRAASAQKRSQRMMKSLHEMDRVESDREHPETGKHGANTLTIPPEPGVCEDKYIT